MSDLSKIEAWIQKQEDELLYDVDGEQAHREYCEQIRAMTPVRLDCSTSVYGFARLNIPQDVGLLPCSSGPLPVINGEVFYFGELMIDRHTPFIGIVDDRDSSE